MSSARSGRSSPAPSSFTPTRPARCTTRPGASEAPHIQGAMPYKRIHTPPPLRRRGDIFMSIFAAHRRSGTAHGVWEGGTGDGKEDRAYRGGATRSRRLALCSAIRRGSCRPHKSAGSRLAVIDFKRLKYTKWSVTAGRFLIKTFCPFSVPYPVPRK